MRLSCIIFFIGFIHVNLFSQIKDTVVIKELLQKCNEEMKNADFPKAYNLAQDAIKLSESSGNEKWLGESLWQCGLVLEKLGKADNSINFYNRGIVIAKKLQLPKLEAKCNHSAGWSYYLQGSYDLALKKYLVAVKLREESKDSAALAWTQNNIGLIYWQQHNLKKALDFFLIAHKIFQNKKSLSGLAIATNNIGLIYEEKKEYDKALEYYRESYYQNTGIDSKSGVSLNLNNIGGIFMVKGDLDSAEAYTKRALSINLAIKHLEGLQLNYLSLSEISKKRKNFEAAIKYAERAIAVCLEGKFPDGLINCYKLMAEIYSDKGDYKSAYGAHLKYSLYNDSLNFGDKITSMEAKYQKEKSEKEITLLKKEKEIASLELKKREWMIYSAIAGALLLLGVVGFSLRTSWQRKKTNLALAQKNSEITKQKEIIEEKSKDITDSILYAKRIQDAVLPTVEDFKKLFSEHFVIFKPRDIVSGDFYWLAQLDGKIIIILADCTGHGVPGAFMSIIGHDLLNMLLREEKHTRPSVILTKLDKSVMDVLNKNSFNQTNDGMDMAICVFDKKVGTVTFAGAGRPLLMSDGNQFTLIQGSKYSIGGHRTELQKIFKDTEIKLKPEHKFYLLSDGFSDQFGGPKGKKFKFKQVQELLNMNMDKSLTEQGKALETAFENWQGSLEQVDDVCVIGIKI